MHVDGLLKKFRKQFNITIQSENIHGINTEDYNSSITEMISDIETFKQNGQFESHEIDAKNVFFISSLRAGVDYSLSETKYYFISTDQKLRSWDYSKSDNQPIVLLPSHWMSLLLRYVSRTDSDYKAFTSFLNLKIVNDNKGLEHLDQILTGISNVTEDFEAQSIIAESIFEQKFDKILNGLPDEKQIEEVEAFAEKEIDLHLKRQKEVNKQLETDYKRKISEIELEVENKATREAINNKLESFTQIKNEKLLRLREKKH